jgi:hypothetical protein
VAQSLADKDTAWLTRVVEDMIRQFAPSALVNVAAEDITANSNLIIADQVQATQQALEYLNRPTDPWHYVGAAGEPAFQNSWANYGSTWGVCRYRKLLDMLVLVEGLAAGGTMSTTMFTFPVGYRPGQDLIFPIGQNNSTANLRTNIYSDGRVEPNAGTNSWFSINALFLAEK